MRDSMRRTTSRLTGVILAAILLTCVEATAGGGFMVRPMQLSAKVRPGTQFQQAIEVRSTQAYHTQRVSMRVQPLTQDPLGGWHPVGEDAPRPERSAVSWITPDRTEAVLRPMEAIRFNLRVSAPPGARGFNGAAIVLDCESDAPVEGTIRMAARFVVPVLLEMEGPLARQRIEIESSEMHLVERDDDGGDSIQSTTVGIDVRNTGDTIARVGGQTQILRETNGNWTRVATADFRPRRIIPGVTLTLAEDIGRTLPSGRYRIDSVGTIDGRFGGRSSEEVDFAGREGADLVTDVAVVVPEIIEIEGVAGSSRSTVITLQNPSSEPLTARLLAGLPDSLKGVAAGDIHGHHFSCAEWLSIAPAEVLLQPGRETRVRLTAAVPREGPVLPNFYALLNMGLTSADGQSAGGQSMLVRVRNPAVEEMARVTTRSMGFARESGTEYAVNTEFANTGTIHLRPSVRVRLEDGLGQPVRSADMSTVERRILPLGIPTYSATLDLAGINTGSYVLRVIVQYGDGQSESIMRRVDVSEDGEGLLMLLIEGAEEEPATADE